MMAKVLIMAIAATVGGVAPAGERVEATLQRYVADYAHDPQIQDVTFVIQIGDQVWTVTAERSARGEPASARLSAEPPSVPTMVWKMDGETFDNIANGRMTALTASGKAFASDPAPLEMEPINGFEPTDDWWQDVFRPLILHFWTRGQPEVVRFGFERSRLVHGGRAIPAVYAPGIRSGWYGLLKGDHINKDSRSQKDPWSAAFFIIKGGTAEARIGDNVIKLEDNSMIHVPPRTVHEFWNNGDVPAEMIMVTYGKDS